MKKLLYFIAIVNVIGLVSCCDGKNHKPTIYKFKEGDMVYSKLDTTIRMLITKVCDDHYHTKYMTHNGEVQTGDNIRESELMPCIKPE